MSSRIEQIIDEIEDYIDSCKFQGFSNTKIIVNKDEIEELLRELRLKTPDEIKRYQKIISNKNAIMADAQAKADALIQQATAQTTELVSEHEIMQQAYSQANAYIEEATRQAQEILDKATVDANNYRLGAIQYTDEMLGNLSKIIQHTSETAAAKYENFVTSLNNCLEVVEMNRRELAPQHKEAQEALASVGAAVPEESEEPQE